jgi:ATP-binding cassette subfamily B multidrug efflux pump
MSFGRRGAPGKPLDFKGTLGRLLRLLLADRLMVTGIAFFGIVSTGLSVLGPKLLGNATNQIFDGFMAMRLPAHLSRAQVLAMLRQKGEQHLASIFSATNIVPGHGIDFGSLGRLLLLVAAIYLVSSVLSWFGGVMAITLVQRLVANLRNAVEEQVNHLPLAYIDREERGEILSTTTNDLDNLAQSLAQSLNQMLISVLTVIGTLVMMLVISPLMTLIAVVTLPLAALIASAVMKRSQPQFVAQWNQTGHLNSHIEEVFSGHEVVKVFGRQRQARKEFDESNQGLYGAAFKAQFISGIIQPVMMFVSNLNYVLVAVAGGLMVTAGNLTLGSVQALIQYSRQFSQPLTQLASMVNMLQSGLASAERVFRLLDQSRETPEPVDAPAPEPVRGHVVFDHVRFSYSDEPLIKDLSLVVEPGQTVAIVGPTGAGKTTLTNLVLRFYELDGGRITLDGFDIAKMSRSQLRRDFGVVLQDTWLFDGTIRDNIAYGADNPSEEQIRAAAKAALVDHFVRTLPKGYETPIDAEGGGISAGQQQLLTIARAFLADPAILILDEATSSVDTRTESLVQSAMDRLRAGRTSFVIAHRLSTIRDADHIVVMEHGDIVEQGDHESLIAAGGAYQALYQSQFSSETVG